MLLITRPLPLALKFGGGNSGEIKILEGPTMLQKTKEIQSHNLDGPTMLMKTNDLIFYATISMKRKQLSSDRGFGHGSPCEPSGESRRSRFG